MTFETGAEEYAYDKGWAHAKEVYEFDVEHDRKRIVGILESKMKHDVAYYTDSANDKINHSQFCRLCELTKLINEPREETK